MEHHSCVISFLGPDYFLGRSPETQKNQACGGTTSPMKDGKGSA
jgi:hypothetical protein